MKVLVCGGREWSNREAILREMKSLSPPVEVIHGDAKGADRLGASVALELGFSVTPFPALWSIHGKAAGMIRNKQMLDQKPDIVFAFHLNLVESRGTRNMVEIARRAGVEVRVFSE